MTGTSIWSSCALSLASTTGVVAPGKWAPGPVYHSSNKAHSECGCGLGNFKIDISRSSTRQMKTAIRAFSAVLFFFLLGPGIACTWAQINITTERYDNSRTGANLNETVLTTSNVNSTQFGKLYSYVVDGSVQAQPLYLSNLTIPSHGSRNVLFVVTMNDVVYAFDADSNASNGGILWKVDFRNINAGVTLIPIADIVNDNRLNIVGNVGIESTPAIDLNSNTMYLVARTKEVSGAMTNYVARLHALDITTGAEKFAG